MANTESHMQPAANRLLASLPPAERDQLMKLVEPIALEVAQLLYEPNQPITHVYFPLTCVVSLIVLMEDGAAIEIGAVGNEGMVGLPVFLGAKSTPGQALTQIPGAALRMPADLFVDKALRADGALYRLLHRYTQALFVQSSQGVACNRFHSIEERFCRWMLMTHDRAGRESFPLRHEFIGQMLGIDDAAVVEVTAGMEKAALVANQRGTIAILDRVGLEAASCECYRVIRDEFDRLFASSQ